MSFGSQANAPAPEPEPTGIEDDQISNAQEAVPIPYIAGRRRLAVKWMTRIYNQRAQEAPAERPGKK